MSVPIRAGKFEIRAAPAGSRVPAWCDLFYEGKLIATLHPAELADLGYCLKHAKQRARKALGRDADEV